MRRRASNLLGLAMHERAILCAQVAAAGSNWSVRKLARFEMPATASLDKPEALGAELLRFLRQHHFDASRAVVGVPAKWLIAHERQLPPSEEEQAKAMLRLQAERLVAADNTDLVFDFMGQPSASQPSRVLMVGMLRQQLDRIRTMVQSARLSLRSVSATPLVLTHLVRDADDPPLVVLTEGGADLVLRDQGLPRTLRHVPLPAGAAQHKELDAISGEMRRVMALTPGNGRGSSQRLLLCDGLGLNALQIGDLSQRMGLQVQTEPRFESLQAQVGADALNGSLGRTPAEAFVPAVALVIAAAQPAKMPVDFEHSRLTPPPQRRIERRTALMVAAGVALVAGLVGLYVHVQQSETQVQELEERLEQMADNIEAAEATIARVTLGRGYYETRPPILECMRDLTLAYGENEPIWTSGLNLRDNGRGQLQGRATDQRVVLAVLDRLRGHPRFNDVQLQDMREGTGRIREVLFSVSFVYQAREARP